MDNNKKMINRRELLKTVGAGAAAFAAAAGVGVGFARASAERPLQGKKICMVIDLQRCTGCGACNIACVNENNVREGFAWSSNIAMTTGTFPNVRYDYAPTLCNHCANAPCVRICPVKAMHKTDGGITAHNSKKCIGCKACKAACPYEVISINVEAPYKFWKSEKALIEGCTAAPAELTRKVGGSTMPYYNKDKEGTVGGAGVRYKGIAEKCTFCDHRLKEGVVPYCVEACPARARIVGDLNDPDSAVSRLLAKYKPTRLKEHLGTDPQVYYIRSFNPAKYEKTRGDIKI